MPSKFEDCSQKQKPSILVEGLDYYVDASTNNMVFTAHFLEKRGYCCGNGCRHCPFEPRHTGTCCQSKD